MAPKKRTPGERRRHAKRRRRAKLAPDFKRPREWGEQELIGVRAWLARLKGPDGAKYPQGWRRGMIKHYEKRARLIRAEISASKKAEKGA